MNESGANNDLGINTSTTPRPEYVSLIARGAGILFAGTAIGTGLRYLFQMIVARYVGAELFGLFSLGYAVFLIAETIALLGMRRGVLRYVALYQGVGDRKRAKGTVVLAVALSLGGGIVISLLLIALSEVLAIDVFHAAGLTDLLRFFAVAVPFSVLTTVLTSSIQALRIMRYIVYVRDLFEPLSRIALAILVFLLGWRLWGVIFAFVVSIMAGAFLSSLFYRKVFSAVVEAGVQPVFEPRGLVTFCWPLLLSDGLYIVQTWSSTFLLGYFAAPAAVGIFSASYRTALSVQGVLTSFNTVFAPIISDLDHRAENRALESLFKLVTKWIFSLSFPATLLMVIFSREILTIFGEDFAVGATSMIVLSIGQFINSLTGPLGLMISMSGRSRMTLLNSMLYFFLQAGLCFVLIPRYEIMGAALATTVSIGFLNAIQLLQVHRILKIHPFQAGLLKPLIAGGVSGLVLTLVRAFIPRMHNLALLLVLGSAIFLAVYGLTLCRLGFDEEDKVVFHKIRARLTFGIPKATLSNRR